jgi:hypothetical protein
MPAPPPSVGQSCFGRPGRAVLLKPFAVACREGGVFQLRLTFLENYPEKPPRVRFTSEIFHPNVYGDGTLCMDIIQDQW